MIRVSAVLTSVSGAVRCGRRWIAKREFLTGTD